ncbi:AHH domain-containing protein [Shewanella frigidimarina]|uniref:AHH domain-containing protein n=1 Tax=Shewanella frigidimarina TaxID=56812 RepID=UPI003D7B4919
MQHQNHSTYPQPTRPSNPSTLELAIFNFELKAKSYYDTKQKNDNSKELLKQLERDYQHLQTQKKQIESVAIAQAYLAKYRSSNQVAGVDVLLAEAHHPTDKLGKYLFVTGEPQPTINHEAHHIIPGKGRFLQPQVLAARMNMHIMGIGINDPFNGTWLINFMRNKKFDWATKNAPSHRKLHRKNYESWIGNTLGSRSNTTTRSHFLNKLRSVKQHIKTGTIPEYIFDSSDTLWKGL